MILITLSSKIAMRSAILLDPEANSLRILFDIISYAIKSTISIHYPNMVKRFHIGINIASAIVKTIIPRLNIRTGSMRTVRFFTA